MITLNKIVQTPDGNFSIKPFRVNPSFIISVGPAAGDWGVLREVVGEESPKASELTYQVGQSTETIVVLGNYDTLLEGVLNPKRRLLND